MSGFLCSMVGATFSVAAAAQILRSKKGITAVGNAQVDTAQSKFGGASLLMDGNGDRLNVTGEVLPAQYTVEYWFRLASFTSAPTFVDFRGGGADNYSDFITTGGVFTVFIKGSSIVTSALSTNTWYHIAVVRDSSSDIKLYLNGTKTGVTLNDASYGLNTSWYIGDNYLFVSSVDGHMDEIRVSNTARYTANFSVATAPFVNDDNTVLLVHANGTDATTFFEDDNGAGRSPVGIAANGNALISTTQSKFGGSSAYFDGTGDYLLVSANTALADLMNGDFTIEFWMYSPETGIDGTYGDAIIGIENGGSGSNGWLVRTYGTKLQWVFDGQGGYDVATFNPSANTWHHIAFVRSGTTLKCYTDGTERTVTSYSDRKSNSGTYNLRIGKVYNSLNDDYIGYLDEVRISNTARYNAAFTAPITPFVNDANTLLLIHADGTNASTVFRDDNGIIGSTPKVLSPQGNTQISTAQYKFGASSAYFDGTGDYLRLGQPGNFNFGSDNWTIEGFIRPTNNLSGYKVLYNHNDNGTDRSWFTIQLENSTLKSWGTTSTGSWSVYSDLSFGSLSVDTWYHFALVRDGSTMRAFLNGTQINTASCTGWTIPAQTAAATLSAVPASYWYGWMDGIRISNTARYGASGYTTPTSAFTQDSNTLMLLNFEGANASTTFIDSAGRTQKGVSAIGNAQVSTAQSKFGGSSALFDGNADRLSYKESPIGTADFTYECWAYQTDRGNIPTVFSTYVAMNVSTAGYPGFYSGGQFSGSIQLALNTWTHIAWVRSAGTIYVYVGGVLSLTQGNSTSFGDNVVDIASNNDNSNPWTGNFDEMRISNIARYTANFTPSTTPFQNDDNTLLLLHMDGTNGSTVFFDDNGAKPYTP